VNTFITLKRFLPSSLQNKKLRESNDFLSPIEKRIYTVEGDLWRVKMEGNDCDYHLELSAHGAGHTADRIIAEIPAGSAYAATRKQLLSMLPGDYIFQPDTANDLTQPIPISVTGYAFCDGHHYSSKTIRGSGYGTRYTATRWEVHPVWKVESVNRP
jgi:hypothetical protein